jgi:hypothetical protein
VWEVILSKKAQEDLDKLTKIGLFDNVKKLIAILRQNPFLNPPAQITIRTPSKIR